MTKAPEIRFVRLAIADLGVFGSIVALLSFFRPDIVFPLVYLSLYPYTLLTGRGPLLRHLLLASASSLAWMLVGGGIYDYQDQYYSIGPISIYPLAAWAVGFFLAYLLAADYRPRRVTFPVRFTAYVLCYWSLLILYETVAYHVFGIRNPATLGYPGLPLCDCIHAPLWVQLTYLSMGPAYYLLCEWLGLNDRGDTQGSPRLRTDTGG